MYLKSNSYNCMLVTFTSVTSWLVHLTLDQAASWGYFCCVLWQNTFNSHSASLCPGVQMGTDKFSVGGNPVMD